MSVLRGGALAGEGFGIEERFVEEGFEQKVSKALSTVRMLLGTTRKPTYAEDQPHTYDDKFALAEHVASVAIAAQLNALEALGLTATSLQQAHAWAASGESVTLRLTATERTSFEREASSDIEQGPVEQTRGIFGTKESQVVTRRAEYFWRHEVEHELLIFAGANATGAAIASLRRRTGAVELMTTVRESPRPAVRVVPAVDVEISWLFRQLAPSDGALQASFKIDRSESECLTPRRNPQVEAAMGHARALFTFAERAYMYLVDVAGRARPTSANGEDGGRGHKYDLPAIVARADALFVPVLPLFEEDQANASSAAHAPAAAPGAPAVSAVSVAPGACAAAPLLRLADVQRFLAEQRRSLAEARAALAAEFGAAAGGAIFSASEAEACLAALHLCDVLTQFTGGLEHIEAMLTQQLGAAVGKELTPADFAVFMAQHEARLFTPQHAPRPFSYAIRRPEHSPEGSVAIEGFAGEPVHTITRRLDAAADAAPISFALNAATRVRFGGERFVHAYLAHQFGPSSMSGGRKKERRAAAYAQAAAHRLHLTARARQFSAFILVVGTLGAGRTFEPKHALIVQNKDEVSIPLLLETLPTPKAFRDAVASLSPEQQRFAKAYRALQLAGSVFGVLVLQLKPQLERVLNLPADSLTKEIALTQQLLDLFITHQIPADLLSYDGEPAANGTAKVGAVKQHVAAIVEMVEQAKKEEVASAKEKFAYNNPGHSDDDDGGAAGGPGAAAGAAKYRSRIRPVAAAAGRTVAAAGAANYRSRSQPQTAAARGGPELMMMKTAALRMPTAVPSSARIEAMEEMAEPAVAYDAAKPPPVEMDLDDAMMDLDRSSRAPQAKPQPQARPTSRPGEARPLAEAGTAVDFTALPARLEAAYDALDGDAAIRPTKIKCGDVWRRRSQAALLATPTERSLFEAEQEREKSKAFDLIDAMSRSGALSFEAASLHVVVAATHHFDLSLVDTVVQGNVNPIEKLERSSLIIASTIHGAPASTLLQADQLERVAAFSAPALLPEAKKPPAAAAK